MNESEQFFYDNAGYSYDPKTETAEQGRRRCAWYLARAEKLATEKGFRFQWSIDPDITTADWSDEKPEYKTWQCWLYDENKILLDSIGGVDFGPNGEPWTDDYARVIQAELALNCGQFVTIDEIKKNLGVSS